MHFVLKDGCRGSQQPQSTKAAIQKVILQFCIYFDIITVLHTHTQKKTHTKKHTQKNTHKEYQREREWERWREREAETLVILNDRETRQPRYKNYYKIVKLLFVLQLSWTAAAAIHDSCDWPGQPRGSRLPRNPIWSLYRSCRKASQQVEISLPRCHKIGTFIWSHFKVHISGNQKTK